jgi:hypothetical protein
VVLTSVGPESLPGSPRNFTTFDQIETGRSGPLRAISVAGFALPRAPAVLVRAAVTAGAPVPAWGGPDG